MVGGRHGTLGPLCSSFFLTTLLGLIVPKGLDTNGTLGSMLGVHLLELTDHNISISLLLLTSVWALLSSPIEYQAFGPIGARFFSLPAPFI